MILVDTSVLIDYFKGINNPGTQKLQYIQEQHIQFGICNLIYQEILQGSTSEKEFGLLKSYLETQHFYEVKNDKKSYEDAAKLYRNCRKKGLTIRSTIDLIIAQIAIENDLYLLHNDKDYENISEANKDLKIY